jgi:two-component sensor histidine kinase
MSGAETNRLPPGPGGDPVRSAEPTCVRTCTLRSESDHRVANHLAMLSSYVGLKQRQFEQTGSVTRESIRAFCRSIDTQIRAIARLHRLLMAGGDSVVDLSDVLHEVASSFAHDGATCLVVEDYETGCVVSAERALLISQVANEAMCNALKYACGGPEPGRVALGCRSTPLGGLEMMVSDDGPGLPDPPRPGPGGGFGLKLMQDLGRRLAADLEFRSSPGGLSVVLTVPAPAA